MKSFKLIFLIILGLMSFYRANPIIAADTIKVSPAKFELDLKAGERQERAITITNDTDHSLVLKIVVEDFVGSDNVATSARLVVASTSPYSLRDNISIKTVDRQFVLGQGERKSVPFSVQLASSTPAGGRYASILFVIQPTATGTINTATRVGVLVFARISGQVLTQGVAKEFDFKPLVSGRPPIFEVLFANEGEMYLNPYGYIKLENWRGREVDFIPIDPWFVMPKSLRLRQFEATASLGPGWYRAILKLNRGYENKVDTLVVSFFVWSWWLGLVAVILVVVGWWSVNRYFLWRKK